MTISGSLTAFFLFSLYFLSCCQADIRGNVYNRPRYSASRTPTKAVLAEFTRLAHGLRSGNVTILNTRTFFIPKIYYDGAGPDAFFFLGTGPIPVNGQSMKNGVKIPNEVGSYGVLKKYSGQDITLKIPGPLDITNYDWLAMWCVKYTHLFGYVLIPKDLNVPNATAGNRKPAFGRK